jgi:hypothetical protein
MLTSLAMLGAIESKSGNIEFRSGISDFMSGIEISPVFAASGIAGTLISGIAGAFMLGN